MCEYYMLRGVSEKKISQKVEKVQVQAQAKFMVGFTQWYKLIEQAQGKEVNSSN